MPPASPTVKKYRGSQRRLVISFDVGTTFSGASYCFLEPNEEPKIFSVTRFPGQEYAAGAPKIPSIMYYDKEGNMRAAGAEVNSAENVERADDEEWIKVEWFKLRMRPKSMPSKLRTSNLPPLPLGKNLLQVFGDYMSYLMNCTASFIRDTHANIPSQTFDQLRSKAEFIIAHPNGWEGAQQARLRKAAVLGGLVPDTPQGRSRVSFVSEGEASLHYCIGEGLVGDERKGFLIADLGGGTLDFSAYEVTGTNPLRVHEMAAARCELEGSSFVTLRGKGFLQKKLEKSIYGTDEHIGLITARFDETAKRTFRSQDELCLVQFGSVADKDPENGIRRGSLRLTGEEVKELFEPSIAATVNAVRAQKAEAKRPITAVYLVGGFSASPYLIATLKQRFLADGLQVSIPDSQTAKAVADGAIAYYLDGHVSSRVAKVTYGAPAGVPYNAFNPEHLRRTAFHRHLPSGRVVVNGGFEVVLEKGTTVDGEKEFRRPFFDETTSWETLNNLTLDVIAYTGNTKPPKWIDETDHNLFKNVFKVQADTSTLQHVLQYQRAPDGSMYWRYDFALVIKFGSPELKAQLVWNENGIEQRSPAQIVYEDDVGAEVELDEDDNGEEDMEADERRDNTPAVMNSDASSRRSPTGTDDPADLADRMARLRTAALHPAVHEPNAASSSPRSPPRAGARPEAATARTVADDATARRNVHPPHIEPTTRSSPPRGKQSRHSRGESSTSNNSTANRANPPATIPVQAMNPRSADSGYQSRYSTEESTTSNNASTANPTATMADPPPATLARVPNPPPPDSAFFDADEGDGISELLTEDEDRNADVSEELPCYPDPDADAVRIAREMENFESRGGLTNTTPGAQLARQETLPPAYPTPRETRANSDAASRLEDKSPSSTSR